MRQTFITVVLFLKCFTEEGREAPHPPASISLVQCQRVTRGPAAWPRKPLSNMDSAGSYDSVISTNSGYVSSDPLTSVPLTLLLYSWPYNTNCRHIPTSTVGCDSLLDTQVEMWKHFKKTFLKGDQFDVSTISEHKPKSRKSKETVRAFYFLLQGCCIAPP